MKYINLCFILCLILIISGCGSDNGTSGGALPNTNNNLTVNSLEVSTPSGNFQLKGYIYKPASQENLKNGLIVTDVQLNDSNYEPVNKASVSLNNFGVNVQTDINGLFLFSGLNEGEYALIIDPSMSENAKGYSPIMDYFQVGSSLKANNNVKNFKVVPKKAVLLNGRKRQFRVLLKGTLISPSDITWTVEGGIGTIDSMGLFTATNKGNGKVIATCGDYSSFSTVKVKGADTILQTGSIHGFVSDGINPVTGAIVIVDETGDIAITGSNGEYLIPDLEPGTYTVSILQGDTVILQYQVQIGSGNTSECNFTVSPTPTATVMPTVTPSFTPTAIPTDIPSPSPTPVIVPTDIPSPIPTFIPTSVPTELPNPGNWFEPGSWEVATTGTANILNAVSFPDANNGWVVGQSETILKTSDGGNSWISQHSGASWLYDVQFIDNNNGWAVGANAAILRTSDGGTNWYYQASPILYKNLNEVHFIDSNNGWIAGVSSILHTTDGGNTWTSQIYRSDLAFYGCYFTDSNNGWVLGRAGSILHTDDGGVNWTPQSSGTTYYLADISFVDSNNGWIAGPTGIILHTGDGGNNWSFQNSGVSSNLFGIDFVDLNHGSAVGENGTVLYTDDGGNTWTILNSAYSMLFQGVYFLDLTHGWMVGTGGTVLYSR